MDRSDLPKMGEPGSAEDFQLNRLREWGLGDLADACTSREQALLVHHCALFVRNVWAEVVDDGSEPPPDMIRQCLQKMIENPEEMERVETFNQNQPQAEYKKIDLRDDNELFEAVKADIEAFRAESA